MGSTDHSDTEISEAPLKNLIPDGHHSSNKVDYFLQMLQREVHLMHIMSRVSIPLHIVISDCLLLKADICRKHIVGDSLASDKLSPSVIPCIKLVMSKRYLIATLLFSEGISISQLIDALT